MDHIQNLSIENNGLKSVNLSLRLNTNLHILRLSGNPWVCDCSLYPLHSMMLTLDTEGMDQKENTPMCAAPESLSGHSLLNMTMTECYVRQASAVAAEDKGGVSLLIIIIGGSTLLVILCVVILACYLRGRGVVGTQFSQVKGEGFVIEAGHGV